ncbi:trypsin-like peptidase domain-containing protein [Halobacillus sp. ACCC02827]|uniref:S1C family serine protease n=1 Tax=Halobacillus sp. ACCC02827 TaxID=3052090 RepID=UPI0025700C30|nr:trypsin-like peptidase domain-containing protein [Halobacillus sp. ACCC02827]WJE17067.1 trypsin-like peptidase domain-containing protein [Halobacillus sp. ACCC02827]
MNRAWIISIAVSLILIGGGAAGVFYIMKSVPGQMTVQAVLSAPPEEDAEKTQVPKDTQQIIFESQKLVVQVELEDGTIGSGFLYNDKGDILTNAHVVANAKDVSVITADSKSMPGEVIGISRDTDIAVVRVPGLKGKEPLPIRREDSAKLLDEVLALGSPLGLQNTVTRGEISGLDRTLDIDPFRYENMYQISAPIERGNSGGPLLDRTTGDVIGINSAKLDEETIGFSIPIADVLPMVERWSESPMKSLPEFPEFSDQTPSPVTGTDAEQASYLVQYFYDSINQGDFVTAFSLLSSSWQEKASFEEFRSTYHDILNVQVDNVVADPKEGFVEVTAFLTTEETVDGDVVTKKYKVVYPVVSENRAVKIGEGSVQELKAEDEEAEDSKEKKDGEPDKEEAA